jgi:hypothetical protein
MDSGFMSIYEWRYYTNSASCSNICAAPPTEFLVPVSTGPPDSYNCDAHDDEDPSGQLL